jgi:hypothetical protein
MKKMEELERFGNVIRRQADPPGTPSIAIFNCGAAIVILLAIKCP